MKDGILLRSMTAADADGVYLTNSEAMPATAEERQQVMSRIAPKRSRAARNATSTSWSTTPEAPG